MVMHNCYVFAIEQQRHTGIKHICNSFMGKLNSDDTDLCFCNNESYINVL